jgi:hypothetical protein
MIFGCAVINCAEPLHHTAIQRCGIGERETVFDLGLDNSPVEFVDLFFFRGI